MRTPKQGDAAATTAKLQHTIEAIHPKALFVAPLKEDAGELTVTSLRAKNHELRMAVESARKLIEAEDERVKLVLKDLGGGKEDAAAESSAAFLPIIPETVPGTIEGLAEQNRLLMDVLESARQFVNAEEKVVAQEQEGEKKILLKALAAAREESRGTAAMTS